MSHKASVVEEFDDDTDLPLPNHPLANTGSLGPLLEQLDLDSDRSQAGPASPPRSQSQSQHQYQPQPRVQTVVDTSAYKTWTCIYPIYLDAKRPYGTGQRRVARAKSLWWPLSKDIADAASRLGLGTLHEVTKAHPRDWENPGRVRVQWKKDGRFVNPMIKSKKQLLETICFQIQMLKPENIPKPPYTLAPRIESSPTVSKSAHGSTSTSAPADGSSSTTTAKSKHSTNSKSTKTPSSTSTQSSKFHKNQKGGRRLPAPPSPLPSLANRVSAYTPLMSSGILLNAVNASMGGGGANSNGSADGGGAGDGPFGGMGGMGGGAGMGGGKGKRKVIRIRG